MPQYPLTKKNMNNLKELSKKRYGKCHYCGKELWLGEALLNKDVCDNCFKKNIQRMKDTGVY